MESEVDTSILNSINIKRFTKSVLEEYGAEIDRSNRAKWEVSFPNELSQQLDRDQGTLVFDAADRELGAGDLLVQPGTRVFSALLETVEQSGTIGYLQLTEDSLQVNLPEVLRKSALTNETTEFSSETSDTALTFHFRVQFETPSSFHNEEMVSVTIDPDTQARLPDLTERLTSHLPQLLEENNEHRPNGVSHPNVEEAFEEAQQAVIERSRPTISEIREEADESVSERIQEISDWYDQRRDELEEQLEEQRQEIQKWKKKRRKAQKDSTRRKYIQNRKKAERELEHLEQRIETKRQELDVEESEEIDQVIDRNQVDIDVSLLGVTEVSYVRGELSVDISSAHAQTTVDVSYLPATDEYHGLDCECCTQDLTDGFLPQLCANGHLVGDPCATTCRSCNLSFCDDCDVTARFETCTVCWEAVCQDCTQECSSCRSPVCSDHIEECSICDAVTCHLCGEDCESGGSFCCDDHLSRCPDCGEFHCQDHTESCARCGEIRCRDHIESCSDCGDGLCTAHATACETCGETFCSEHVQSCTHCRDSDNGGQKQFCGDHAVHCDEGGEIICNEHRITKTIGSGVVCPDHYTFCESCEVGYSDSSLSDGRCTACSSLGNAPDGIVPPEIRSEFRKVKVGKNQAFIVILGKKLLGRNKIIIYDRESNQEVDRRSAGMLKQLLGEYE